MNRSELIEHLKKQTKHVEEAHLYDAVLRILNRARAPKREQWQELNVDFKGIKLYLMWRTSDYDAQGHESHTENIHVRLDGKLVLQINVQKQSRKDPDPLGSAREFNLGRSTPLHGEVITYLPGPWETLLCSKELETFAEELANERDREAARKREAEKTRLLNPEEQEIAKKFGR
jgi:hypothetical protein